MDQVSRTEIQTGDMRVCAIGICERRKSDAAESGHSDIIVMGKAIKELKVVRDVDVCANATHVLIDGDAKRPCKLREWDHVRGVLSLLGDLLVFGFPEPSVLNERSTKPASVIVAAERRLGRIDQTKRRGAGCKV